MYLSVHLDNLRADPHQVRQEFSGISELASDIHQHGLLQNLVVLPLVQEASDIAYYPLCAGERRFRALKVLKEENKLPKGWKEWLVPVLVIDSSDASWVNIVENLHRFDLLPWELGRRFLELIDAGHSKELIAVKVNKSIQYVYQHTRISQGLHVNIIERIRRIGREAFPMTVLTDVSKLVDDFGEPLEEKQHSFIDKHLQLNPPGRRKVRKKVNLQYRVSTLQSLIVPDEHKQLIEKVHAYLTGKTNKLVFDA